MLCAIMSSGTLNLAQLILHESVYITYNANTSTACK